MKVTVERVALAVDDPWVETVTAAVHRPARPAGAALLLTHGAGKDLDVAHLVALADAVAATGRLVVRVNQPWKEVGRGAPPPVHLALPGYLTVAAAVRAAFGPRRAWVVGGHSNGARLTTHALGDRSLRTAGAVLVSYPLHPPGKPDSLRVEHWPAVAVPTLFLQGTADAFGGAAALEPHLVALSGSATLHPVEGADHSFAVPSTRSADGRRHEPTDVGAALGGTVSDWIRANIDAA